jgi:hypothetical protein
MMKIQLYPKAITCFLALSAICIPQLALAERIDVELQVSGTAPDQALIVTGNSKQCDGGPIDCIKVKRNSTPNIFFHFDAACQGTNAGYKLNAISLSMVKGVPTSPSNPLPATVVSDFNADAADGKINLNLTGNQLQNDRIKFHNKNSYEYTVFYEIKAIPCSGGGAGIKLDPAIRNEGK